MRFFLDNNLSPRLIAPVTALLPDHTCCCALTKGSPRIDSLHWLGTKDTKVGGLKGMSLDCASITVGLAIVLRWLAEHLGQRRVEDVAEDR